MRRRNSSRGGWEQVKQVHVSAKKELILKIGVLLTLLLLAAPAAVQTAQGRDSLDTLRNSDTPFYVISFTAVLQNLVQTREHTESLARIDWSKLDRGLQEIASASGGRAYSPQSAIDLSAIYDDLMENLKVRYVITYRSSINLDSKSLRTIRVQLVDPETGDPVQIVDESGHTLRANVSVEDSYVPSAVSDR